jgi:hypothetical protein
MKMIARLRYVATTDFRRSEATNFAALPKTLRDSLRNNDAVCFRSGTGNQLVFVFRRVGDVVASTRLRLPSKRRWDPLMLADYAAEVGIELVGLKRLKDHLIIKASERKKVRR